MRKLSNWLQAYIEFTENLESPLRLRTWAGIGAISTALQRRVWTRIKGQNQFPNLYVFLIGPPGIGKGNAVKPAIKILRQISSIHLAPEGITRRSFYSSLENSLEHHLIDGEPYSYCSLAAWVEELGVFVRANDLDFQYHLAHVYDNPPIFHYKTEHMGEHFIENASFSLVASCTPKGLKDILSDLALEIGFPARVVMVHSADHADVKIFEEKEIDEGMEKLLTHDLEVIHQLYGKYSWSPAAASELQAWADKGLKPLPKDPRFQHYNTRRLTHITKLCIVMAAATSDDMVIGVKELQAAKELLLDAESEAHLAIEALGSNPLLTQQQTCIKVINSFWTERHAGLPESALRRIISAEVHPQYIDILFDSLAAAKWVETQGRGPDRVFFPRGAATGPKPEPREA